jgi:hypothetical protein
VAGANLRVKRRVPDVEVVGHAIRAHVEDLVDRFSSRRRGEIRVNLSRDRVEAGDLVDASQHLGDVRALAIRSEPGATCELEFAHAALAQAPGDHLACFRGRGARQVQTGDVGKRLEAEGTCLAVSGELARPQVVESEDAHASGAAIQAEGASRRGLLLVELRMRRQIDLGDELPLMQQARPPGPSDTEGERGFLVGCEMGRHSAREDDAAARHHVGRICQPERRCEAEERPLGDVGPRPNEKNLQVEGVDQSAVEREPLEHPGAIAQVDGHEQGLEVRQASQAASRQAG